MSKLILSGVLAVSLCQGSFRYCQAASAKPQKSKSEIQVPCGNLFGVGPDAPIRELLNALERHPRANIFRVTWDSSATLGQDEVIALFNRKNQTLKLVYRDWWRVDMETYAKCSTSQDQWLFSGVTESALTQLGKKVIGADPNAPNGKASLGFYPWLTRFGCKVRHISHFSKSWHEKP
ncbi:hypothetical protein EON80_06325 [bacterium]|nr:MAG: hypothetical protein EON80_06325 [bacterium]